MIPRSTKYTITFINRGVGKMISEKGKYETNADIVFNKNKNSFRIRAIELAKGYKI